MDHKKLIKKLKENVGSHEKTAKKIKKHRETVTRALNADDMKLSTFVKIATASGMEIKLELPCLKCYVCFPKSKDGYLCAQHDPLRAKLKGKRYEDGYKDAHFM